MVVDGKREKGRTLQESRKRETKRKDIWTAGLSLSSLKGEINQCSEKGAVLCE